MGEATGSRVKTAGTHFAGLFSNMPCWKFILIINCCIYFFLLLTNIFLLPFACLNCKSFTNIWKFVALAEGLRGGVSWQPVECMTTNVQATRQLKASRFLAPWHCKMAQRRNYKLQTFGFLIATELLVRGKCKVGTPISILLYIFNRVSLQMMNLSLQTSGRRMVPKLQCRMPSSPTFRIAFRTTSSSLGCGAG